VSKIGLVFDRNTKQIVRKWTEATFERNAPGWSVWFAQPVSTDLSPYEVLKTRLDNGFVMFLNRPSRREQAKSNSCLQFGGSGGKVNFHAVHPG
jgi:hypothetical protein